MTAQLVGAPRQHEQVVAQSVQIHEQQRPQIVQTKTQPLGASRDGARQVQRRTCRAATGENERGQWWKLRLVFIDGAFHVLDVRLLNQSHLESVDLVRHARHLRAEHEELRLQFEQGGDQHLWQALRGGKAEARVELIN